jgi:CO/xanthine dehydrogenase Mo-binding subunit
MLVGRILRSPLPHARIVALDTTRADRLAGVGRGAEPATILVSTSGYSGTYGRIFRDQSVVALDKVRFVGDPVAAVAGGERGCRRRRR